MKQLFALIISLAGTAFLYAQENDTIPRKKIEIKRVSTSPKIDGILDDEAWKQAPVATDFVERMPNNGVPAPDSLNTEVKIVYNDLGIYFGASMKDPEPGKIMKELTERDNIGNDDFFFILLNGYNDHQQSMQFIVTAAGVQYDAKMTNGNEDSSWNAVWYSAVDITDQGWVAEMFIPYSELRFPKKNIQEWGLNMEREFRRTGSRYTWSPVDNSKGYYSIYDGELHGIKNIDTPVRLSFQPYISTYLNNYDGNTEVSFNGGMDLKYGINNAFTLDMILIPDFGQTKFDESVLNLSAFEVQYDEQRAFFTEGTELFSKGDLFYSRRVGGAPSLEIELADDEEIRRYPASVDLINAVKISGRTDGGLGIGFFNAITEKTYVDIYNSETNEVREFLVAPFTNYNILVLDQRFSENSSVSFVNTNTTREGHFRDANVTGIYANLTNKKNTLNFHAGAEGSVVMLEDENLGMEVQGGISKISGKNRFNIQGTLRTRDYDINDLGYSGATNYVNYHANYQYRYLQPKGFLNNLFLNFNLFHKRRLQPDLYSNMIFNFNSSFTTKSFLNFGGGFETTPFGTQDTYEPRVEGRHVDIPAYYDQWLWFGTDFRKRIAVEAVADWYKYDEKGRGRLILEIAPMYRVSDRLRFNLSTSFTSSDKEEGFVEHVGDDIIFGSRSRQTLVNSLGSRYIFNNSMALNLAFRHYYSEVNYQEFFNLRSDGGLTPLPAYDENQNTTYNSWNLDFRFSWWFAPGSQLTLLYRNAVENYLERSRLDFSNNFEALFNEPQVNNLSLKINYYVDYNRIKNWFKCNSDDRTVLKSRLMRRKNNYTFR